MNGNNENHGHLRDTIEKSAAKAATTITKDERKLLRLLRHQRTAAYKRFPLAFTMLGTFGLVATFYGFEHLIDYIPILRQNPVILLSVGVATLLGTGTLYKKLS